MFKIISRITFLLVLSVASCERVKSGNTHNGKRKSTLIESEKRKSHPKIILASEEKERRDKDREAYRSAIAEHNDIKRKNEQLLNFLEKNFEKIGKNLSKYYCLESDGKKIPSQFQAGQYWAVTMDTKRHRSILLKSENSRRRSISDSTTRLQIIHPLEYRGTEMFVRTSDSDSVHSVFHHAGTLCHLLIKNESKLAHSKDSIFTVPDIVLRGHYRLCVDVPDNNGGRK